MRVEHKPRRAGCRTAHQLAGGSARPAGEPRAVARQLGRTRPDTSLVLRYIAPLVLSSIRYAHVACRFVCFTVCASCTLPGMRPLASPLVCIVRRVRVLHRCACLHPPQVCAPSRPRSRVSYVASVCFTVARRVCTCPSVRTFSWSGIFHFYACVLLTHNAYRHNAERHRQQWTL